MARRSRHIRSVLFWFQVRHAVRSHLPLLLGVLVAAIGAAMLVKAAVLAALWLLPWESLGHVPWLGVSAEAAATWLSAAMSALWMAGHGSRAESSR